MDKVKEIKFHRIDRLYEAHQKDIDRIGREVYSSGQVLGDKSIRALEERIGDMCKRKYAVALGSCTDALYYALQATDLVNCSVLVNMMTFEASKSCIRRAGGHEEYFWHDECTFLPDFDDIESTLNISFANIRGIVFVNLFGQMADMKEAVKLARKHNLVFIEDAAQSFTSHHRFKPAGSFGDVSCLSFDPMKVVPAFGTAGMLLTNRKDIAASARFHSYKNYGSNCQMTTFNARLINYWLDHLPELEEMRIEIAKRYNFGLMGLPHVKLPIEVADSKHVFHKFVIKCKDNKKLKEFLAVNDIATKIHYESGEVQAVEGNTEVTGEDIGNIMDRQFSRHNNSMLSLPIYPYMEDEEVDRVVECIRNFYS